MPSEKFYQPYDVMDGPGGTFEIVWDGVEIYLYAYTVDDQRVPVNLHSLAPDRDDLNRLIRSLRRARNAKYGSDE